MDGHWGRNGARIWGDIHDHSPRIMESGNDSNQQVVFAEILNAYLHLLSTDSWHQWPDMGGGGGGRNIHNNIHRVE